jgi:Bacterial Ig-like domain
MASYSRKQIIEFLLLAATIFIGYNCANQLPPSGGGVDVTPPTIVQIFPKNGTTNFNKDYVEIDFSKYVDKRSVQDAIFISPAIEEIDYDWSGKDVTLNFKKGLKDSTTYVITVGTDVVDLNNNNKMAQAYTFTFSTGNKIDKGQVSGKVYGEHQQGILIFAYLLQKSKPNPFKVKPDYLSQTGKNGSYNLLGLADGEYRIFAVDDKYKDFLFQPSQDLIGIPYTDVIINKKDSVFSNLNFFLRNDDTTKPRLISASMTDKNHILLGFSSEVDSSVISSSNFLIIDSTSNKAITPVYAFKGKTKSTEMILVINVNPPKEDNVFVKAKKIVDKQGNIYENDFTSLSITDRPDTTKPSIFKTIPDRNSSDLDFSNPLILLYFDDAFDKNLAGSGITFSDTSKNNISFKINYVDDATIQIIPQKQLDVDKFYLVKINLSKFQNIAGNKFDSTFTFKFKTINGLDFTGVSGNIINVNLKDNPVIVLQSTQEGDAKYQDALSSNNFDFERVKPGKYLLWCFLDKDNNKKYSYGSPFPFVSSEQFSFYPDTLNLKPRWVITDVSYDFNK